MSKIQKITDALQMQRQKMIDVLQMQRDIIEIQRNTIVGLMKHHTSVLERIPKAVYRANGLGARVLQRIGLTFLGLAQRVGR